MLLFSVAFFQFSAFAQIDTLKKINPFTDSIGTADQTKIQIVHADDLRAFKNSDEGYINKLIGNVRVKSGDVTMTCDSAYLNKTTNKIKAFGNVDIIKGGRTSAKADYVDYTGATANAIMRGNVQIFENGDQLITDNLKYNLRSKQGIYSQGGQLVSDGTTISSDYGKYNGKTKQAYFKGNVYISSTDADIESKELTYNTITKKMVFLDRTTVYGDDAVVSADRGNFNDKTKQAYLKGNVYIESDDADIESKELSYNMRTKNMIFLDQSTVYGDDAVITTKKGTYNQNSGVASFTRRTTVENNEQIITANVIKYNEKSGAGNAKGKVVIVNKKDNTVLYADVTNYNKETGYGLAKGHIHYIDTTENIKLTAGLVEYNEFNDFLVATLNPLLETISDEDTILIASDTMIALRQIDLQMIDKRFIKNKRSTYELLHKRSPDYYDDKKVIICDKRVEVFGDSMQAVCDSMLYRQTDSIFNLYKKPVVWSGEQQAEGDTVFIYMANNQVRKTELRNNSFIINDTKYPKIYNQIKGKNIDAFFADNAIQDALVMGNAQSIYYATNEEEEFIGLNKAEGAKIKMLFKDKEVERIVFYTQPKGVFYPMEKIQEQDRFLADFKWKSDLRPASRKALRKRK